MCLKYYVICVGFSFGWGVGYFGLEGENIRIFYREIRLNVGI